MVTLAQPKTDTLLRVAMVVPYFAPHIGGVEKYAEHIARGLNNRTNIRVVVITTAVGAEPEREIRDGIQVIRLGTRMRWSNTPINPAWYRQLRALFAEFEIDLVQVHSPVPVLADVATLAAGRRPVVLTYHSGSLSKGSRILDPLLHIYEQTILQCVFRRAHKLVASSETALVCKTGRAEIISPGVDTQEFRVTSPPKIPTVLYVGRMDRSSAWKGVHILIEAFAETRRQVPQARLVLVGGGTAIVDLRAEAHRWGVFDAVEWPGELTGADLVSAYQKSTVVVLPSLTEAESFGMTLIEAMASGRPVIGSRVGGIPAVIRDEVDGLLVPPGEVGALSAACSRVLADPGLAARWGRSGRARAETSFAWGGRVEQYANLLFAAVGQ